MLYRRSLLTMIVLCIVVCIRRWDGWMPSPVQWTWTWAKSGRWWGIGKPGVLQSIGSGRVGHDLATEQQKQCTCQSQPPNLHPSPNLSPLGTIHLFSYSVSLFKRNQFESVKFKKKKKKSMAAPQELPECNRLFLHSCQVRSASPSFSQPLQVLSVFSVGGETGLRL